MDSAIGTAARALSAGDPLHALKYVALRNDAPALALRGIALAQLGELSKARQLLRRAAAAFGEAQPLSRARATVALSEVALALRDLNGAARGLDDAVTALSRHGDVANAAFGRLVQTRRLTLLGDIDSAEQSLGRVELSGAPPRFAALASLTAADLAMKRLDAARAARALQVARGAALRARIPALLAEVVVAERQLAAPVARLRIGASERALSLAELPEIYGSSRLILDACRREARLGKLRVSLVSRPLLLELLLVLGTAAPEDVTRDELVARVFGAHRPNESHRVRLRVEVGRLRQLLSRLSPIVATPSGFALTPRSGVQVATLLPPADGEGSALLALLQSGEAWATSALAAALGKSQRAVQRALSELEQAGKVRASGAGRSRRWVATPAAGIATTLLLVAPGTLG